MQDYHMIANEEDLPSNATVPQMQKC